MTTGGVRPASLWREDALHALSRIVAAKGVEALKRNPVCKALLAVVGAAAVEEGAQEILDPPGDEEVESLLTAAKGLLREHRAIRHALAVHGDENPSFQVGNTPEPPPLPKPTAPKPTAPEPTAPEMPSEAEPEKIPALPEGAFSTRLPLWSIQALAASLPAGEWGSRAAARVVEPLGWMDVALPFRTLNDRMFVAQVEGHSMDDGRSGLRDGAHAVFEFGAGDFDREPIVLVRGAFDDPETGSYAVKRIRLEKDAGGAVSNVRLLSQNPDRSRYPEIVIEERDAASVSVLARLVRPLSAEDFARGPAPKAPRGRRDVTSSEGANKHRARLAKAIATFFGAEMKRAPEEGTSPEQGPSADSAPVPWTAHLELTSADPGALSVVVGPLTGLLSRVKIVTVASGGETRHIFASNLRDKTWREPVSPSVEPYSWTAVDFEEDLAEEMGALTIPGLAADRATVFRVGPDGTGARLSGGVTPGNAYRLLVPPALSGTDRFNAIDIRVASPVPAEQVTWLRSLGVGIGPDAYSVRWIVTCPRGYGRGRDRELYPRFGASDDPVLHIEGPRTLTDGEVQVIVQGEAESQAISLPAGERWIVEILDLAPGKYGVEVVPLSTSVETSRLFLEVVTEGPSLPSALFDVTVTRDGEGASLEEGDLSALGTEALPIAVRVPPYWPVYATWTSVGRSRGRPVHAGEDGRVDMDALLSPTARARAEDPLGELTIDAGELGVVTLRHARDLVATATEALPLLVSERAEVVRAASASGDSEMLRGLWIEPILTLLGYRTRPLPDLVMFDVAPGFGAMWLDTVARKGESFERRAAAILLVSPARLPLTEAAGLTACKQEATRLCKKLNVEVAIVTSGLLWTKVTARKNLMPAPIDLPDAVRRAALGGLDAFLERLLVEVG